MCENRGTLGSFGFLCERCVGEHLVVADCVFHLWAGNLLNKWWNFFDNQNFDQISVFLLIRLGSAVILPAPAENFETFSHLLALDLLGLLGLSKG